MNQTKRSLQSQAKKITSVSASRYLIAIVLLLLCFELVNADFNIFFFASENVDKDPNFEPLFAFYSDTKLVSSHDKLEPDLLK